MDEARARGPVAPMTCDRGLCRTRPGRRGATARATGGCCRPWRPSATLRARRARERDHVGCLTMAHYSMRPATEDDLDVLRDLYRRSSLSNENDRANLLAAPEALHWAGAGLAERRTRVAVDEEGRILGFATCVDTNGGQELEDLFVDPDAMRKGVATQLVQDAVSEANRSGVPWIEVTGNQHAAEFYASAGFVRVGVEHTLFGPAPRLRRDLAPP